MRTIYKYTPELNTRMTVQTHQGSKFLSAQVQRGVLTIWLEVDTDKPLTYKDFELVGTGKEISIQPNEGEHVATVQMGYFVWHLYELRP